MKNRKMMKIVNWLMLLSLVVVFVTGILLKPMPGMWMGITHGVSGFVLMICAVLHCVQHGMFKKKK
ncbi:MAG: hypothetical protein U0L12_11930 [Ruminococcus sp.]|nr:hypothetical protein [Ruminococcus sp.]